jgi:hypothetical protein
MATLSTWELSKQPEKHEPPERVRKKNEENEQCVWSIIANPSCSRGIPKYNSLKGKMLWIVQASGSKFSVNN